jgi:lipopolysaccharide biosynthesis regulator YciM
MKSLRSYPILRGIFGGKSPDDAPYRCVNCGTTLSVQYQQCPECGSYTIDRAAWLTDEGVG